jgi:HEAT repeat protein
MTYGCYEAAAPVQPTVVVARLMHLLQDPDAEVRRTAALSLGKIGRPEAAPALIPRLTDRDARVRQYTAWALGNMGEPVAGQAGLPLAKLLYDPDPEARAGAARALGQLGASAHIVKEIIEVVRRGPVHARLAAIHALAWLEAPAAYPALVKALDDSDAQVRQAAVAALGELADRRAVSHLFKRLAKDPAPGVRAEAAYRLGQLDGPVVLPALRAASTDADPGVRRWAAAAIRTIQDAKQEEM